MNSVYPGTVVDTKDGQVDYILGGEKLVHNILIMAVLYIMTLKKWYSYFLLEQKKSTDSFIRNQ